MPTFFCSCECDLINSMRRWSRPSVNQTNEKETNNYNHINKRWSKIETKGKKKAKKEKVIESGITSTAATAIAVVPNTVDPDWIKSWRDFEHPSPYAFTRATHSIAFCSQHDGGVFGIHSVAECKPQHLSWNKWKYIQCIHNQSIYDGVARVLKAKWNWLHLLLAEWCPRMRDGFVCLAINCSIFSRRHVVPRACL